MTEGHIFVHDPKSSHKICWICGMKKEEHPFVVERKSAGNSKLPGKTKVTTNKKRQRVNVQS